VNWTERFRKPGSALCVGLDPVPDRLPVGLSIAEFCCEVVDATAEYAACFKPNIAFFEREGWRGIRDLAEKVLPAIRARGVPVLIDAKRGDVPSTAEVYADAFFRGELGADALTVNPSLGLDAVEPFRRAARELDRGVFLLLRTSNEGAGLFQDAAEPELVKAIRAEPAFGAVVGATDPGSGARLRAALPGTLFLVPGFGAQGGSDLRGLFDDAGEGAIVNSSRGILYAGEGRPDWKDAIRAAARRARDRIEEARG
jgi:orotidine-5'-phosphate decarboxylase